ncbi:hypothetical protein H4S07_006061 [Coemansia furcata]|uniref:Uncharacterized protein n=1 Tax=Coemansia furcata TaxID=417177 RepID=A0ACC1KXW4_9FUNG|nr:hypothetical protein H4S07_006061 [Coemansia furcata]
MNPTRASAIRSRIALLALAPLLGAVVLGFAASVRRPTDDFGAASVPSPWASKRNPLNTYVAKFAWAWTTMLFVAMLPIHIAPTRAVLRYAMATLYWLAMTRWFFGPPLFDRLFVRTGGVCQISTTTAAAAATAESHYSMTACRAAGGAWAGGHDVSGHCFLLLHSGLFLAEEVLSSLESRTPTRSSIARWAVVTATLGLVGVWLLMLFFTAKYFHGLDELVSGSLLGIAYWFAVYRMRILAL